MKTVDAVTGRMLEQGDAPGNDEPQVGASDRVGSVSAAALLGYEEAVFRISAAGAISPANPAAQSMQDRTGADGLAKLAAFGRKAITGDRAFVDMADIGHGETQMNLQVTIVPLADHSGALCFVRDLTLDYSLRRALVDSRRRYRDFVEICADFTWETAPNKRFAFVAPRGGLGYPAEELLATDPAALIDQASAGAANPFLTHNRIELQEIWLKRRDGRPACMMVSALPLIGSDGAWIGARGVCRDVSDTREREATFARVHNRERVLTRIVRAFRDEVNPEAMLTVAADALAKGLGADHSHIFRIVGAPPGASSETARHELAARHGDLDAKNATAILASLAAGAGAAELVMGDWQALAAPTRYQSQTNGAAVLWRKLDRGSWNDDDRLLLADIANQIGVTIEQLIHHEHILRISRTDALTGLLNRGAFIQALERHVGYPRRDDGTSVLIYVDLDNFKAVNDLRGHAAGDEALLKVRDVLLQSTRPTDMVARLGGDEFAIWLLGADRNAAETRAKQILDRAKVLLPLSGNADRPLGMSVGIAPWSAADRESVDELIARADAAMYTVKKKGKGSFVVVSFGTRSGG
jgi:diguanylate cyclase (GGDEF)-like protein